MFVELRGTSETSKTHRFHATVSNFRRFKSSSWFESEIFQIFFAVVSASAATFHKLRPNKIYKTVVEPFVDFALKGIFTGSVVDPVGHLFTGGGKRSKHPKGKHFRYSLGPYQNYHHQEPYLHQEHDSYFHHQALYPLPCAQQHSIGFHSPHVPFYPFVNVNYGGLDYGSGHFDGGFEHYKDFQFE